MGLFFDVLSAINNPNQQGSVSQLESITGALQHVSSSQGIPPTALQSVVSQLGPLLRPALSQQGAGLGGVLGQLGAAGGSAAALQTLFPPQMQQQVAQAISQKTGISASVILAALPAVIPAVLSLLNMGSGKPGSGLSDNPVLSAFLDGDRDGDTDLGDVLKFATRFINPAQA